MFLKLLKSHCNKNIVSENSKEWLEEIKELSIMSNWSDNEIIEYSLRRLLKDLKRIKEDQND